MRHLLPFQRPLNHTCITRWWNAFRSIRLSFPDGSIPACGPKAISLPAIVTAVPLLITPGRYAWQMRPKKRSVLPSTALPPGVSVRTCPSFAVPCKFGIGSRLVQGV